MKKNFLDSNIFLEVLARKGGKSDRSLQLLETGKNLWTSVLVICEIEWVLRSGYELKRVEVAKYLKRILSLKNISFESYEVLMEAVLIYENNKADLVDCINALLARKAKIKKVYSYDKHFDNFDWLDRVEP